MRAAFLCLAGVLSMTGCATANDAADESVHPAQFASPPTNATREIIRRYIYDTLGTDYLVDIDSLLESDTMIARDRGRAMASGRPIIAPDVEFRLELVSAPDETICQLVPVMDEPDKAALILPLDTDCRKISSSK